MFLVADIGNSNIVIAIYSNGEWTNKFRYDTKDDQPQLFYENGLGDLLLEWRIKPNDIKNAVVSSVVPSITDRIVQAIHSILRFKPTLIGPQSFMQLKMEIPKIYEIGSDLVANAYGAKKLYGENIIVVDFGTALTFTVFKLDYGISGVTIAPGLKTIISTLSGKTAQLPQVEIKMPDSAIGTSTSTAIRAGVLFGFIGMVKELLSRIQAELPTPFMIVATGGLCTVISELTPLYDIVNKNLTLDGIRMIAEDTDHNST